MEQIQRLDKLLAHMGVGTRSELRKMARQGRLRINDKIVKDSGCKADAEKDRFFVDDLEVVYRKYVYLMMNKPPGVVSATRDAREKTVLDLLREEESRFDLFPVGRLDKDTEGLLLLTNDGRLAHELLSPRKHVSKTYYAEVDGAVEDELVKRFGSGLTLDDGYVTLPADLRVLRSTSAMSAVHISICEGKYHQIKRMFQTARLKVTYLKRISMGPLLLDERLEQGAYRPLSEDELELL